MRRQKNQSSQTPWNTRACEKSRSCHCAENRLESDKLAPLGYGNNLPLSVTPSAPLPISIPTGRSVVHPIPAYRSVGPHPIPPIVGSPRTSWVFLAGRNPLSLPLHPHGGGPTSPFRKPPNPPPSATDTTRPRSAASSLAMRTHPDLRTPTN